MRLFLILLVLGAAAACRHPRPGNPSPVRTSRDTTRVTRQPVSVRDTALEQRAARLELKVLEQAAQVEELQRRLDDARREVVRAMAKLQSLATRAEAASGMAEAEIALQALRSASGTNSQAPAPPEYTTGRANVREGPGAGFKVLFTLETGVPVVAYSYVDQWVRVKDDSDRSGWIHQTLIGRRPAP